MIIAIDTGCHGDGFGNGDIALGIKQLTAYALHKPRLIDQLNIVAVPIIFTYIGENAVFVGLYFCKAFKQTVVDL